MALLEFEPTSHQREATALGACDTRVNQLLDRSLECLLPAASAGHSTKQYRARRADDYWHDAIRLAADPLRAIRSARVIKFGPADADPIPVADLAAGFLSHPEFSA